MPTAAPPVPSTPLTPSQMPTIFHPATDAVVDLIHGSQPRLNAATRVAIGLGLGFGLGTLSLMGARGQSADEAAKNAAAVVGSALALKLVWVGGRRLWMARKAAMSTSQGTAAPAPAPGQVPQAAPQQPAAPAIPPAPMAPPALPMGSAQGAPAPTLAPPQAMPQAPMAPRSAVLAL